MIDIEVAFAMPAKQRLIRLQLGAEATVAEAVAQSGIAAEFSEFDMTNTPVGVWGRVVNRETVLCNGDRVEIYRGLELNPREARRQLALVGQTMASTTRN